MRQQLRLLSIKRQPSTERLRLLTYPMAFAQPNATVPLLQKSVAGQSTNSSNGDSSSSSSSSSRPPTAAVHVKLHGAVGEERYSHGGELENPYRWVRGADELCVANVRRSKSVNNINSYVVTYKFDDPQWAPLLLPEVTLRSRRASRRNTTGTSPTTASTSTSSSSSDEGRKPDKDYNDNDNNGGDVDDKGPRVVINHNKLLSLECMARHANYALRHIVQKGHGVYLLPHIQHSVLHPRGLIEQSYVTCAYGVRGERLRTDIIHVGPLNAADVIEPISSSSHSSSYSSSSCVDGRRHGSVLVHLGRAGVRRGVVAVSQAEGYGTWFSRKPMLWQRARRVGALQSQLAAHNYTLAAPALVGRQHDVDVALLQAHIRHFAGGGADAVGLVASTQIAQQRRMYVGEFEAPAHTALDVVHQLAHNAALRSRLVTPVKEKDTAKQQKQEGEEEEDEYDDNDEMEILLPVSWATRTPPPYVPLEVDLPFKLQMSKPVVLGSTSPQQKQQVYPTGGTIGSPFVTGAPIVLFEYNLHQGVDHYVFDDAPSARPMKWWSQKSNMPYSGYMYFVRSGLVDRLTPTEEIPNPLEPETRRKPLHTLVPPNKAVQRRILQYKKKMEERAEKAKKAKAAKTTTTTTTTTTKDGKQEKPATSNP
ncbi:uncharacterized protein TM35_000181350 [Trypanosoma theileri]|uniref:Uncharacterized protein n=1 Tax=Trypanosoma theileri TaxID=67003 RepID=A0A1X0NU60_9TRYP|nr:uncharacterized protein TM35_000181350 [Trypanosoma theileri]ORC88078.1 hypothetical protein TM35_000181350 [Trypanosoma theileri]